MSGASWTRSVCVCVLALWGASSAARGGHKPLPRFEQAKVNQAVDRGVAFLRAAAGAAGTWAGPQTPHPLGHAALPALTLLECGESSLEPAVQRAAEYVRKNAWESDSTYELSLTILFLDRLKDGRDEKLIRYCAARLIAGQTPTGGWGYKCPKLSYGDAQHLLGVLKRLDPETKLDPLFLTSSDRPARLDQMAPTAPGTPLSPGETGPGGVSSPGAGQITSVDSQGDPLSGVQKRSIPRAGWCVTSERGAPPAAEEKSAQPRPAVIIPAKFRGLPVMIDPAKLPLRDLPKRDHEAALATTDNSNTQFALLALHVAKRHGVASKRSLALTVFRFRTSQNEQGGWGYRYKLGGGEEGSTAMTCVGLLGLAVGHGLAKEHVGPAGQNALALAKDPMLLRGLKALGDHVGMPAEKPEFKAQPGLYFLWSVERVGVLYDLPEIGGKDWYRWAAQCLLVNQQQQGNWDKGGYPGANVVLDTCLALLVLKKANLTTDLGSQLNPADLEKQLEQEKAATTPLPKDPAPETPKPPSPPPDVTPEPPRGTSSPSLSSEPASAPAATPQKEEGGGKFLGLLVIFGGLMIMGTGIAFIIFSKKDREEVEDDGPKKPAKKKAGVGKTRRTTR